MKPESNLPPCARSIISNGIILYVQKFTDIQEGIYEQTISRGDCEYFFKYFKMMTS